MKFKMFLIAMSTHCLGQVGFVSFSILFIVIVNVIKCKAYEGIKI